jgi:hypothetical protein
MLTELERRAWEKRGTANDHVPVMALKVVLDDIERGEIKPRHIIVIVVEPDEVGDDMVHRFNAGDLSTIAIEGAMFRALRYSSDR